MLSTNPLLSIVIPTKDRYNTLITVVSEITSSITDANLEIIICDNSSIVCDNINKLIESDRRIKYYHNDDGELSIVKNTENAIELSNGDYLCFIGDDDFVSPYIMEIVLWLSKMDEDCLVYPPANYWWNDVEFARPSRNLRAGSFWLPKNRNGAVKKLDTTTELDRVLTRGGTAYMNLPRLYHGIVARGAIQRIKNKFGTLVPGSSPDMALCVALALTNDHYLSIDYPLTAFGASKKSGGGWTAARRHYGRIADQHHLPQNILENWDVNLPEIWSEQIIYAQTIHEVLSKIKDNRRVFYPALYGSLLAYEPHVFQFLRPVMIRRLKRNPGDFLAILKNTILKMAGRIRTVFRSRTGLNFPYDTELLENEFSVMKRLSSINPNISFELSTKKNEYF
jgi:glycosyltransferase involved in cell wall biosynthesis